MKVTRKTRDGVGVLKPQDYFKSYTCGSPVSHPNLSTSEGKWTTRLWLVPELDTPSPFSSPLPDSPGGDSRKDEWCLRRSFPETPVSIFGFVKTYTGGKRNPSVFRVVLCPCTRSLERFRKGKRVRGVGIKVSPLLYLWTSQITQTTTVSPA